MISEKVLLCAILLVGAVEGSCLHQHSNEHLHSNGRQNPHAKTHQRSFTQGLLTHHSITSNDTELSIPVFFPPENLVNSNSGVTSSISQGNLNNNQIKPDLNIVIGKPVNGGAKNPFSAEPIKNEERSSNTGDTFIGRALSVAAAKVNDLEFLNAIQSIEDHIERTVIGSRRTSSTPKTISSNKSQPNTFYRAPLQHKNNVVSSRKIPGDQILRNSPANELSNAGIHFRNEIGVTGKQEIIVEFPTKSSEASINGHSSQSDTFIPDIIVGQVSAIVSPPAIIRKPIVNPNTELKEFKANIINSSNIASLNSNTLDNNTGRPPFNRFPHNANEGHKQIIRPPSNANLKGLQISLPLFTSQNVQPAKLVSSTTIGDRAIGNLLVLRSGTTPLNIKSTQKTSTDANGGRIRQLINQPSVIESFIQQNLHLNQQSDNSVKQTNRNSVQPDNIKNNLSSAISNVTPSQNNSIDHISIGQAQTALFIQNNNSFSLQSEHSPPSNFSFTEDNVFSPIQLSDGTSNNRNPHSIQSTILPVGQQDLENPFTQSKIQTNSFTPSLHTGPLQIAQFINSVQPTISGDLESDIIRPSQINKDQTKSDSLGMTDDRLSNGIIFEKTSFFDIESNATPQPIGFTPENVRRPIIQSLKLERVSNAKNSRFRDDVQLSHIRPNPDIFPEVNQVQIISQFRNQHSPSNEIFPTSSSGDTFSLSGFGTNQPGVALAAFDPEIRLAN